MTEEALSGLVMGKEAQYDGETMVEVWQSPEPATLASTNFTGLVFDSANIPTPPTLLKDAKVEWESVGGLEPLQLQALTAVATKGVFWTHPTEKISMVFTLHHGGDVEADGNCLFTASQRAMELEETPLEVRLRTVKRFLKEFEAGVVDQQVVNTMIRNMYSPNLATGWGVHVVQEVKLLAKKSDREALDAGVDELMQIGVSRYTLRSPLVFKP